MAACRVGINAFCMVLLVGAEVEGDSVHAERMETAVGCFELILLIGRKHRTGVFSPPAQVVSSIPVPPPMVLS